MGRNDGSSGRFGRGGRGGSGVCERLLSWSGWCPHQLNLDTGQYIEETMLALVELYRAFGKGRSAIRHTQREPDQPYQDLASILRR